MIVDIAFAVVPFILGFGAAGPIGSAAIRTAKDVMNTISVLQTLDRIEKFRPPKGPDCTLPGDGGGGGTPPVPPDIKSNRKEQNNETEKPRPIHPPYGFSDSLLAYPFRKLFRREK